MLLRPRARADFRNGRTLVLTQLRRYAGDSQVCQHNAAATVGRTLRADREHRAAPAQALANELSAVCGGAPVRIRGGRMEVKGRHRETVCGWLASMGF